MNDQFIQGVIFDWDRIDNDSYLKRIEAFGGVKNLISTNRLLFCWRKWQWQIHFIGGNCRSTWF